MINAANSPVRATLFLMLLFVIAPQISRAADKTGFGISGGIGPSVLRDEDGNETFRGDSFGFILGVEYRFTTHFALGVNYFSLGTADDIFAGTDTEVEADGVDLTARLILPLSEKTELFGIIGGANYYADVTPGGSTGLFGSDAWEFGAGVDFNTSENFAFRIEGRYFRGERDETGGLLTAGFSYRF